MVVFAFIVGLCAGIAVGFACGALAARKLKETQEEQKTEKL